jgi:hypothetical protein
MDLDVVEAEQLADPKAKVQQLKKIFSNVLGCLQ